MWEGYALQLPEAFCETSSDPLSDWFVSIPSCHTKQGRRTGHLAKPQDLGGRIRQLELQPWTARI
eukprot:scaffold7776_cov20-Tisochrysis_lutea.AAC.1